MVQAAGAKSETLSPKQPKQKKKKIQNNNKNKRLEAWLKSLSTCLSSRPEFKPQYCHLSPQLRFVAAI
jgi:hypothetical protein